MAQIPFRNAITPESDCTLVKGKKRQFRYRYIEAQGEEQAEIQLQRGFLPVPQGLEYNTCSDCDACVPARVDLTRFEPAAWQLDVRALNTHLNLSFHETLPDVRSERAHLYLLRRYMESEHQQANFPAFHEMHYFNFYPGFHVRRIDARDENNTLQASMIVHGANKSVFGTKFFYEPKAKETRIGNFIMLETLMALKARGYQHLYLGDVAGHGNKYTWKLFLPIETYDGENWTLRGKRGAKPTLTP